MASFSPSTFTARSATPPGAGLEVPSIGIGAWSWGDRSGYWGWNKVQQLLALAWWHLVGQQSQAL